MDTARGAGLLKRTTFFVVADHGFSVVKEQINANALLKANGLITREGGTIHCSAWAIPEGGTAMVYITDTRKRAELVPQLKPMLAGIEGVAKVYDAADFPALGLPLPDKYDQMADLLVAAQPGYAFAGEMEGAVVTGVAPGATPGSHGYLASDSAMDTFFIAWGRGVKRGARLQGVRSVDLAPTIAHLLGLKMEGIAGRLLAGSLE